MRVASPLGLCLIGSLFACSAGKSGGDDRPLGGDAAVDGSLDDGGDEGGIVIPDGSDLDATPPCEGLKCQQVVCDDGGTTSVSGTVYDPAGKVPLYNVIVYVPNAPLDPFPSGASCDKCGAIASGSPIVTTLSDSKGKFKLTNVPVGKDIPIVYQVGKWRRKVILPEVKACTDNGISDRNQSRLPRSQAEGDLPQMALVTGGCDELECLFRKVGIADSEFTSASGKGRVHMYKGQGGGTVAGITDAQPFWSDVKQLKKYDITILSCECSEYPTNKGTDALNAMAGYLNAGGRVFASHYHYYWFKSGPPDLQSTATWSTSGIASNPYLIDTTFPKGKAFSDWLMTVGASTTPGQITLNSVKNDVTTVNKATSQRWVYAGSPESAKYFSFNTPVAKPAESQCGRAVFSDIHVSNEAGGGAFPGSCTGTTDLAAQEKALEFLFFDLSSCIQKDGEPPKAPPPK